MSLSTGNLEYSLGALPVIGKGFSWTDQELDNALSGPVAEVVFDDAGNLDLQALLSSVPETEFDQTAVRGILTNTKKPENWRVGEALAESYLAHKYDCYFPWPDGRDERRSGSSLPGADLVGFQRRGDEERFAFGEIKTSSDENHPPKVMYGPMGLKQQLEDLRNKPSLRDDLVKYLGHRAVYSPWKIRYKNAASRYLKNSYDVRVYGVLIRDVSPHENDLKVRVSKLVEDCPEQMNMELLAIYLPVGSISTLSSKVIRSRNGGEA